MITYYSIKSQSNELRGLLHNGYKNIPVVIVHGFFSSNKIGPYRLYYELAEFLSERGFSVLRVDFSAMGESDGSIELTSFETHVNDLCTVIRNLAETKQVNKVHIIAHCIGCCTSLSCLEKVGQHIFSLNLLSPFIPNEDNYTALLGKRELNKIKNDSFCIHNGMHCDKSFIDAGLILNDTCLLNEAKQRSLKVYFPEKDQFVDTNEQIEWANTYNVDYQTIQKADHNFLNQSARQQLFNNIYENLVIFEDKI